MELEVEWKFVVTRLPDPPRGPGVRIDQGYFSAAGPTAIRVRLKDGKGSVDFKVEVPGSRAPGAPQMCREFIYPIPGADAAALLALAPWRIVKTRWMVPGGIELDVFEGPHAGLVIAEAEVPEGTPAPPPPPGWEWRDVSSDLRYVNRALAEHGIPPDAPRCAPSPRSHAVSAEPGKHPPRP
jgi:CYTH domain-containing protein